MSGSRGTRSVETVIVGGGHAGLLTSRLLAQAGREHVVLERRVALGGGWQDRWDGFQLVSPNWTLSLPDMPYDGPEPAGYMPRDEIIARLRRYAEVVQAPVELGVDVRRVAALDDGPARFHLETSTGDVVARNLIVAAGGFQIPQIPLVASGLDRTIHQLHAHDYRRVADLPPGGVLVVGSGQSGVQLAEELHEAGRRVVLAVGRCGRVPRRYRGRDIFAWLHEMATRGAAIGAGLPTPDLLPDPRLRYACNPHVSGHGGGHTTNLREFGKRGMTLVGRVDGAAGTRIRFAPGLGESLAFADRFFDERVRGDVDKIIEHYEIDVPAAEPDEPVSFEPPEVGELDLAAESISTVLWTSGYRLGFSRWIELPVFDDLGFPIADRGIPAVAGLAFVGVPWQTDQGSGNLVGVARDAEHVVTHLS